MTEVIVERRNLFKIMKEKRFENGYELLNGIKHDTENREHSGRRARISINCERARQDNKISGKH